MPAHNDGAAAGAPGRDGCGAGPGRRSSTSCRRSARRSTTCARSSTIIFDRDSVFEFKPRFGRSAVTALARLDGQLGRRHRQQPDWPAAARFRAEACRKIIDFQVMCDSFNIPLRALLDTPGFRRRQGRGAQGRARQIMNLMNCTSFSPCRSITVIVRKAYGRAYVAMGGGRHNDEMVAWPTAEVSFMDPGFATTIVHGSSPAKTTSTTRSRTSRRTTRSGTWRRSSRCRTSSSRRRRATT